jgi:zinc transport system substrate-binding protein
MISTKITAIFLTIFILFFVACTKTKEETRPIIAVTTFALYDITKHIAKNSVKIVNILPFGVEPHEYEPTPKLVASLEKSALVLYSGAGLEPWTRGFVFKKKAVDMSEYVVLQTLHDTQAIDPHYWLNFENMKKATEIITKELIAISPKNKNLYQKNKENYLLMLENLNLAFQTQLATCKRNTIVVNHNAFGYLAKKYNFHVESLSGLSPDAEPNAKNIIRLINLIKEHNVSTVFFEDFASDKAIKGVANATQTQVDILKPLGNITADEAKEHLTYEDMMQINLDKLSKALSCH